jgi:putative transposase
MANTYTQIHIQAIFVVKSRKCLINIEWQDELYKYISGITSNYGHKVLQINGMPDHIHMLFGFRPTQALSDLMKQIKQDSSAWINQKGFLHNRFSWQAGYGAFSYAKSQVPNVIRYIQNQEEHHRKRTFTEEYVELLKEFEVEFDQQYIFNPI